MTDDWEALVGPFATGAYDTVKGRVRTHVIHEQLLRHLAAPPASILDIGGGAGHQAIPLARLGYEVTLLDSSPSMLAEARRRLSTEPAGLAERVEIVEAQGEEAAEATAGRLFEAVLCHGVLMYLAEPSRVVEAVCQCVARGGLVSIVALNAETMAVRPALERRFEDALAAFDATVEEGVLGLRTRADTRAALSALLLEHGVASEAWYGVFLVSDWLALAGREIADDDLETVLALELAASSRDPYREMSRLFHVVGRRTSG